MDHGLARIQRDEEKMVGKWARCLAIVGLACAEEAVEPDDADNPTVSDQIAPPPFPTAAGPLVVSSVVGGHAARMTYVDLVAGSRAVFLLSTSVVGQGPCPAALQGQCLLIEPPLYRVGTGRADADGIATIEVPIPPSVYNGQDLQFQAVAFDPVGNAETSNFWFTEAGPTACSLLLAPVCGYDGVTYDNTCFALSAGWPVEHTGACP